VVIRNKRHQEIIDTLAREIYFSPVFSLLDWRLIVLVVVYEVVNKQSCTHLLKEYQQQEKSYAPFGKCPGFHRHCKEKKKFATAFHFNVRLPPPSPDNQDL
jgi:hypothetical protein